MSLEEMMRAIKMRLQDQQSLTVGRDRQIRAELDALWACVEVLAQAADGREKIEVPNYFGDPKRRVRGGLFRRS